MADTTLATLPEAPAQSQVAGFWRRTFAFWIDSLILGIVGWVTILIFFNALLEMGQWTRLIGFAVGSVYFALLEGCQGNTQSLGKHLMKIKVVRSVDGVITALNPFQAWLRYVVIAVPGVLGGINFIDLPALRTPEQQWLWACNSIVVAFWFLATGYLLIFNRPTRQTFSDLLVSSIVVRVDAQAVQTEPIKRSHWAVLGGIAVILVVLSFALTQRATTKVAPEFYVLQHDTAALPGISFSTVWTGTVNQIGSSERHAVTTITVIATDPKRVSDEGLTQVAKVAFAAAPQLAQQSSVDIIGVTSVNLGIAYWTSQQSVNLTPQQWAAKIAAARAS